MENKTPGKTWENQEKAMNIELTDWQERLQTFHRGWACDRLWQAMSTCLSFWQNVLFTLRRSSAQGHFRHSPEQHHPKAQLFLVPVKNVHLRFRFQSYGMGQWDCQSSCDTFRKKLRKCHNCPSVHYLAAKAFLIFLGMDGKGKEMEREWLLIASDSSVYWVYWLLFTHMLGKAQELLQGGVE